jgi:acylphosphatase
MPPFKQQHRFKVVISGKVQGVWFRKHTQQQAKSLGLSGWVRNELNGNVESEIQGKYQRCLDMLKWFEKGSPMSSVVDIKITQLDIIESESDFEIRN